MSARLLFGLIVAGLGLAACGGGGDSAETTTTAVSATTTTTAPTTSSTTTTTEAPATTVAPTTTTTGESDATPVAATPIVGVLSPYSLEGEAMFPPGSVEAHWYQWDGRYVVLYRGFNASRGEPICAGNSILKEGGQFESISNSPHEGTVADICDGVPKLADPPSGVYACGVLLYYLTEIPTETVGTVFGTLEIVRSGQEDGQSSTAKTDIASTPEFEPGLASYELPPSDVDGGRTVECD